MFRFFFKSGRAKKAKRHAGQNINLSYLTLEPRRVLSADFSLIGSALSLDNFTEVVDENLLVDDIGTDFQFTLSEGTWTGADSGADIFGNGLSVLTVNKAFINGLSADVSILDDNGIALDTTFDSADFSGINSLLVDTLGNVDQLAASSLEVVDFSVSGLDINLAEATNDFDSITVVNSQNLNISDFDDLQVFAASATNEMRFFAGTSGAGLLTLDGNLTAGVSAELLALDGVSQISGAIASPQLLLQGAGNFDVDLVNEVGSGGTAGQLAVDVVGNVSFTNTFAIEISNLTTSTLSLDGVTVIGDLDLTTVSEDITQQTDSPIMVTGETTLTAGTGDICLTGGDVDADTFNDNNLNSVTIVSADDAEIVDQDALAVTSASAIDQLYFYAGDVTASALTLNGNLDASQILLQASGGVIQSGGIITATDLLLGSSIDANARGGDFVLNQANAVATLAARVDGAVEFTNSINLAVGNLSYLSDCGTSEAIVGAEANDKVRIEALSIALDERVDATTVYLISSGGVTQGANGEIETTNLMLQGSGNFVLTNANNMASNIAASIVGNLEYVDVDSITVASLICGPATICGVDVDGDLTIDTSGGNLTQDSDAAVVVTGTTTLTAGIGDICFTGGDCDGDTFNDNDFNEVVIVSADDAEIVDRNAMTVNSATATDQLRLFAGSVDVSTLTLNGNITAGNQVLLQASDGVTQTAGIIAAPELLLGGSTGEGDGTFDLQQANSINRIAGTLTGTLNLVNNGSLEIADLTYNSDCGTSVAICGLMVGADLSIDTTNGDLTQSADAAIAVGGLATFTAGTGDICLTGGDCDGDTFNDNDFNEVVIVSADDAEIVDRNALTVNSAIATDQLRLFAGSVDVSTLTLNGNITAGAQVLLQASDGVVQSAGVITTDELLLGSIAIPNAGTGDFLLTASNVVNRLAANVDGTVSVTAAGPMEIISATYVSDCGTIELIDGVSATTKVVLNADGIAINAPLQSTTVYLVSTNGVTQGLADDITSTNLMLSGTGNFVLSNIGNDTDNIATQITGDLEFTDADEFVISRLTCDATTIAGVNVDGNVTLTTFNGDITQDTDAPIIVSGLATITVGTGDICLTFGDADGDTFNDNDLNEVVIVFADDAEIVDRNAMTINSAIATDQLRLFAGSVDVSTLTLNGNITAGNQVLLQASDGVTQTAGIIASPELLLGGSTGEGDGTFDLQQANSVNRIAGTLTGTLNLVNNGSLEIADLTYNSDCGTSVAICGLMVGADLSIDTTNGDLTQSADAAIAVGGLATFTAGTGDICLTGGDCDGDTFNDNDFNEVVIVSADDAEIVDRNALTVNSAMVTDQLRLFAGDVTSSGLTLNGNITAGSQVLLQASDGVVQSAGAITTDELLLGSIAIPNAGTGDFLLTASNVVNRLAANVDGTVSVTAAGPMEIISATYVSDCGTVELIDGVSATTKVVLNADGIAINAPLQSTTVYLVSTNGVTQGLADDITSTNLMLSGTGNFVLSNIGNDTDNIATQITGDLEFTDTDEFVVSRLTCDATTIAGVNVDGNVTLTTFNGDITQDTDAPIIVSGLATITVGTGDICLTFGDADGDTFNDNDLNEVVIVFADDAEIVDRNAMTINSAIATDQLRLFAGSVDVSTLTLNGNITAGNQVLLQASDGVTQTAGIIASPELLLGGSTGEGDGTFDLQQANSVNRIAGTLTGTLNLVNNGSLEIADLTYNSDCGTSLAICGLMVGADLSIDTTNSDLTQSTDAAIAVGGLATFTAGTGDICLTGGDCDGDTFNDNDFNEVVIVSADDAEIVDRNAMTVNSAIATDQLRLFAGSVTASGLTLNGNITAGSQVLLQASDGVTQSAGIIASPELLLGGSTGEGDGTFDLQQANSINRVAGTLTGTLNLVNNGSLEIADLTYNSDCGTSVAICGLMVGADLSIDTTNGDLTQSADAAIAVGGLATFTAGTGDICLTGGDCDGDTFNDNDFNEVVIVSADDAEIVDRNAMTVNSAIVTVQLRLHAGNVDVSTLTLNGNITAGNQMLLQASDGIVRTGGVISATELLVGGDAANERTGDFSLGNGNLVDRFAADVSGSLTFGGTNTLAVSKLNFVSDCGSSEAICGLNIGNTLTLQSDNGDLKQDSDASIVVAGETILKAQAGDICFAGGDCDGDTINDNDFWKVTVIGANDVEIVDTNGITISGINADGQLRLQSETAGIRFAGDVFAGDKMLIQSVVLVDQVSGSIDTPELILLGTGRFELCLDNQVGSNAMAGELAANVNGSVFLNNQFAVELTTNSFTAKDGTIFDTGTSFDVANSLSIISGADNSTAIFDSVDVNAGRAQFIAKGTSADIELDQLVIGGSIGVATADGNATIVNHHANGLTFRADDFPGIDNDETCPHFESSIVNGDLIARATAGDIRNEADATITVTGHATLSAGTMNGGLPSGSNNEFNIILGDQADDSIQFGMTSLNAADASVQLDNSTLFADTFIGTPVGNEFVGGTLFVSVDGSIGQVMGTVVSSDQAALAATEFIQIRNSEFERLAVSAQGSVDANSLTDLPDLLPTVDTDPFAPELTSIDSNYAIIVTNNGDLVIGSVPDVVGPQMMFTGIQSADGHVYIETTDCGGTCDGDVLITGDNAPSMIFTDGNLFGIAADIQNDHTMTIIAAGDLEIDSNTFLRSSTGSVTDIGPFLTPEGLNFSIVVKEGPLMQLFLPTPDNFPTTRTIGDDNTQFIGLQIGRQGEQNFFVQVDWADGFQDIFAFPTDIGNRFERVSHEFDQIFLLTNLELPTDIAIFNDPNINLFDEGGDGNLNTSSNNLNTNDNFVAAFSNSRPQGDLIIPSIEREDDLVQVTTVFFPEDEFDYELEEFEFLEEVPQLPEDISDAYLVRLDANGDEIKDSIRRLDETNVTKDVIAKLKRRVEEGPQYPPGFYRIKWINSGVPFQIDFEKGAAEDLEPDEQSDNPTNALVDPTELMPQDELKHWIDAATFENSSGRYSWNNQMESQPVPTHPIEAVVPHDVDSSDPVGENSDTAEADDFEIVVEDVPVKSKIGSMAGAIALSLVYRNQRRTEDVASENNTEQQSKAISFTKSSRRIRKIRSTT